MIKHIILWKLKDEIVDKTSVKAGIKAGLEGLKGVVPGLVDIVVNAKGLSSSKPKMLFHSFKLQGRPFLVMSSEPDSEIQALYRSGQESAAFIAP